MTRDELVALGQCQYVAWLYYRDLNNQVKNMAPLTGLSEEHIAERRAQTELAWKVIQELDKLIPREVDMKPNGTNTP
jgi:hypothetical protein